MLNPNLFIIIAVFNHKLNLSKIHNFVKKKSQKKTQTFLDENKNEKFCLFFNFLCFYFIYFFSFYSFFDDF